MTGQKVFRAAASGELSWRNIDERFVLSGDGLGEGIMLFIGSGRMGRKKYQLSSVIVNVIYGNN